MPKLSPETVIEWALNINFISIINSTDLIIKAHSVTQIGFISAPLKLTKPGKIFNKMPSFSTQTFSITLKLTSPKVSGPYNWIINKKMLMSEIYSGQDITLSIDSIQLSLEVFTLDKA